MYLPTIKPFTAVAAVGADETTVALGRDLSSFLFIVLFLSFGPELG
jgi:hypothetical protein